MNLASIFSAQHSHLQQLQQLLNHEKRALISMPVDGELLVTIAKDKREQFDELEKLEKLRREMQKKLRFGEDLKSTRKAVIEHGCSKEWEDMLELASAVSNANRMNGTLIERQLIHNQKALNTIAELSGNQSYGPDGQAQRGSHKLNSTA